MANISPEIQAAAAAFNKDELGAKARVHDIAKKLGIRASELVVLLDDQGIEGKKTASSLTREEIIGVVDTLAGSVAKATEKSEAEAVGKSAGKKAAGKKTAVKKTATKAAKKLAAKAAEPGDQPEVAEVTEVSDVVETAQAEAGTTSETTDTTTAIAQEQTTQDTTPKSETTQQAPAKRTRKRVTKKAAAKAPAKKTSEKKAPGKKAAEEKTSQPETSLFVAPEESAVEQQNQKTQETQEAGIEETAAPRRRVRRVVRRVGARAQQEENTITDQAPTDQAQDEQPKEHKKEEQKTEEQSTKNEGRRNRRARRRRAEQHESGLPSEHALREENEEDKTPREESTEKAPEELHPAERDEQDLPNEPVRLKGSARLESQRRWRAENRERTHTVSRSEFLARRESVERIMVVRDSHRHDGNGLTTQVGVVEDGMLVEHFVTSETQQSMVGNIYLGRVQNVLASMEAAFIDIGTGRNAVLYAGEMNWRSPHLHSKSRRIDSALKSGDQILVQVIKDPLGHKGARLTNRISFAGRFLVYFPGGTTAGISRKLPEGERKRLKDILSRVIPGEGGAIIRTAAENVPEEHIAEDVERLHNLWESISRREEHERNSKGAKPVTLYEEPNMLVKVVRDLFNEDFTQLIVEGEASWQTVRDYTGRMAPELKDRVVKWDPRTHDDEDVFAAYELDEQLAKALSRKVWLPSGGYLIIEPTEAMTVIDVNTGSFVGAGGNLEETVTQNNLEAAEEIVRQMRLRDLGGMIVVDFIDMVLEENQNLLLRRLSEFLGRDRTRHKVSEVTSLGLVQMTRKRLGTGLLETFATTCEACDGRGFIVHEDPVEQDFGEVERRDHGGRKERQQAKREKRRREEKQAQRESVRVEAERTPVEKDQSQHKPARAEEEKIQQRGRRRVRRVVRRGHASIAGDQQLEKKTRQRIGQRTEQNIEKDSESAQSGASYESYEEAKRAFDESPRRKRRTRGNSRSDVPPRREDFVGQAEQSAQSEPFEQPDEQKGGRRRRRVVRRSS